MIEVNGIVKQYGSHLAVDHLSFRVEKGQIYGFLGPNGAGKSTTMNIITGYLASNEGTVVINGHDILEEPEEAKKCIGYLPEIPPLYPDMTVLEYLHFVAGLKNVQKSEEEEILADIIEKTYLTSVEDRLIKNLSKGYKQRVGLAQALVGNPEILILDEPTVGLDPKQIIEIRSLIKELAKDHTVILSSHILSEVSAICDQIMIIAHGRLVACDTPENLSRSVAGTTTLKLSILDREQKAERLITEHFGDRADISESDKKDIPDRESESSSLKTSEKEANDFIWQGTVETEGHTDIREELFYLLADAKCPLLEMTQSKLSLEDIFLELTEDNENVQNRKDKKHRFGKRAREEKTELSFESIETDSTQEGEEA
ncbi:MAG: ABC transporter ATP-binding protein [Lachnospiraceae bacterium]|nr:ABC transporter ATP-binding protein [Lachnospiraceae bacterium]